MTTARVKQRCYASQHLSPEENGVLDVIMRLTHGGRRPFLLDGRKLAARFGRCNKNTIYRIIHALEAQGWLVRSGGGQQNEQTGKYDSTTYHVLTHKQWAKVHAGACVPVPKSGQVQSRFEQKPVPESGHSFVSTSVLETFVKANMGSPDGELAPVPFLEDLNNESKRAPRSSEYTFNPPEWERLMQHLKGPQFADFKWRPMESFEDGQPNKQDCGALRSLAALIQSQDCWLTETEITDWCCVVLEEAVVRTEEKPFSEDLIATAMELVEQSYIDIQSKRRKNA